MRTATVTLEDGQVMESVELIGASNGTGSMTLLVRPTQPDPMSGARAMTWLDTEGGSEWKLIKSIVWHD